MPSPNSSWYEIPLFNLYIKPTYSVLLPQRGPRVNQKTQLQILNESNLRENRVKGVLSKNSQTKLKNAVNWLAAAAPEKRVYHKASKTSYKFKLNFITLTLPTLEHSITDNYFKTKMLHNFLNTARYKFGLNNYVWKVETQANGNIHAHITTDCFIHYADLQFVWNRILSKNNLITPYTNKHENLTFDEYNKLYNSDGKKPSIDVAKAYDKGVSCGWTQPNSTDVKAVHKVKDIAAYLAKYMSKTSDDRRLISGRLWGCSYALSQANKLCIEVDPSNSQTTLKPLMDSSIDYKPIEVKDKLTGLPRKIGELFLYKLTDWAVQLTGRIQDAFADTIFTIQNDINTIGLKFMDYNELLDPVPIEIYDNLVINPEDNFCPF